MLTASSDIRRFYLAGGAARRAGVWKVGTVSTIDDGYQRGLKIGHDFSDLILRHASDESFAGNAFPSFRKPTTVTIMTTGFLLKCSMDIPLLLKEVLDMVFDGAKWDRAWKLCTIVQVCVDKLKRHRLSATEEAGDRYYNLDIVTHSVKALLWIT